MKTLSAHLQNILASDLTLATCWKFTRTDAVVVTVCNHVSDITEGGDVYVANAGFTRSNIEQTLGLSVDNHDIVGFFDGAVFTESDLISRRYDGAAVECFMVDYNDPSQGRIWLSAGLLGQARISEGRYTIEYRNYMQLLDQPLTEYYGPYCRHRLGSPAAHPVTGRPGCGVDLSGYTVTGTINSVPADKRASAGDASRAEPAGWFDGGVMTFTSGANTGLSTFVKAFTSGGNFDFVQATYFDIEIGDTYSVHAGCNHLFRMATDPAEGPYTGDCITKFSNGPRFGGHPESLAAALKFGGLDN